jgi:predicted ester cyclase
MIVLLGRITAFWVHHPNPKQEAPMHQDQLCNEAARALIAPFYDVLNRPAQKNVAESVHAVTVEDWRSYASETMSKSRQEFIAQVNGFGKLIPDLSWDIKEVLVAGDRIIVRSEASGTPAGELFGVPHSGRSFKVMAIDIHTVKDGKLVRAHHVEDWASALRQLAGK